MRSQCALREKYRTNRGTPFAGELARRTLDEENFLRLIETLEDGVNRGEAIRVLREVQTDRFEAIPDIVCKYMSNQAALAAVGIGCSLERARAAA